MSIGEMDGQVWKDAANAHFHRWAEHYDRDIINVLLFRPSYRRVMGQLRHWFRRGARGLRILDIGCGTGTLTLQMGMAEAVVGQAVGLDMSENMIVKANEKREVLGVGDRVDFVVGDSEHLPFADGAFDVVTCCNSFHHYPHQDRAVREMHRVLGAGGHLILIDGYRDDVIGWFIFDVGVERVEKHVHHCSGERFGRLLREAGFVGIEQRVFGVCPPALMNMARVEK